MLPGHLNVTRNFTAMSKACDWRLFLVPACVVLQRCAAATQVLAQWLPCQPHLVCSPSPWAAHSQWAAPLPVAAAAQGLAGRRWPCRCGATGAWRAQQRRHGCAVGAQCLQEQALSSRTRRVCHAGAPLANHVGWCTSWFGAACSSTYRTACKLLACCVEWVLAGRAVATCTATLLLLPAVL
jgi:hypothetical protein